MKLRQHRLARALAFGLVIGALAAPTAAAHHLDLKRPDSRGSEASQPSGGIDGGVAAIGAVGLLGLGVGAALAVGRRMDASGGAGPSVANDQLKMKNDQLKGVAP